MKQHNAMLISVVIAATLFAGGCGPKPTEESGNSRYVFVNRQPPPSDIVGTYVLTQQTILDAGLSALEGKQCQLDVRPDGTFSVTNYPDPRSASNNAFTVFLSTSGHWRFDSVGTTYDYAPTPKDCWGLRFSAESNRVSTVAFNGNKPPYDLITIFGDPDTYTVYRFKKK